VQPAPVDTPAPAEPVAPTQDPEIPGVRRSTRVRVQTKPQCVPSFSGKKYEVATSQLDFLDICLHPDSHLIFSQLTEDIALEAGAIIITQLSLRAGLREWADKAAEESAIGEMKQLHMCRTFKPENWKVSQLLRRHPF
jgi:hypothetical protein